MLFLLGYPYFFFSLLLVSVSCSALIILLRCVTLSSSTTRISNLPRADPDSAHGTILSRTLVLYIDILCTYSIQTFAAGYHSMSDYPVRSIDICR